MCVRERAEKHHAQLRTHGGRAERRQILEDHLAGVKGHFGPLNALRFSPDGRSFTSGGEDGYVRLHHFDADYFAMR